MLWWLAITPTGYGGNDGLGLDARTHPTTFCIVAAGSVDGGDRPPAGCHQECRGRQGASSAARPAPVAPEAATGAAGRYGDGAGLLLAGRPSRRQELPLLRQAALARQALLHRARPARLRQAEG